MANRRVTKDVSDNVIAGTVLANFYLNKRERILKPHSTDHDKVVVKGSNSIPLRIGDNWFLIDTDTNVSTATDLDTGTVEAGKDYYVYACDNNGNLVFKISLNSTYPSGFDTTNSRKIGGFHTLCADADPPDWAASTAYSKGDFRAPTIDNGYWYEVTVAGTSGTSEPTWPTTPGDTVVDGTVTWTCREHDLANYYAGDILPASIWDLKHRARNKNMSNAGLVWDDGTNGWEMIYLGSDDGAGGVQSVYGATILDSINWMDYVDRLIKVGMIMEDDLEFQSLARGSNEKTNISGSADPVTTGGHSDTAGRRMISNIGCEDCCGASWQWLRDQSYRLDEQSHTHTQTITHKATATGSAIYKNQAESTPNAVLGSEADETITGNATDPTPSWSWYNLPGGKGSLYRQGSYGDIKLRAGGGWFDGTHCGSRSRRASNYRWHTASAIGGRGRSEPL